MNRIPYIIPTVKLTSFQFDITLCALTTSNDPYADDGDYDWGEDWNDNL